MGTEADHIILADKNNDMWKPGDTMEGYIDYLKIREELNLEFLSEMYVKYKPSPSMTLLSVNNRSKAVVKKEIFFGCDVACQMWRRSLQEYLKKVERLTSINFLTITERDDEDQSSLPDMGRKYL